MKKTMLAGFCALVTSIALTACGGSSSDSSYTGTKIFNNISFTCKSQSAFDSCADTTSCLAAGCSSSSPVTPAAAAAITTPCAVADSVATITATGCLVEAGGTQSAVCSGNKVYMLSGTGKSASDVTGSGSSLMGNVKINGVTFKCG